MCACVYVCVCGVCATSYSECKVGTKWKQEWCRHKKWVRDMGGGGTVSETAECTIMIDADLPVSLTALQCPLCMWL